MINPNEFAYSLTIEKAMVYNKPVGFNAGDKIETVFERAGIDYEDGELRHGEGDGIGYTKSSTLEASDNGAILEITGKVVKQG